jgi:hypothetical protein
MRLITFDLVVDSLERAGVLWVATVGEDARQVRFEFVGERLERFDPHLRRQPLLARRQSLNDGDAIAFTITEDLYLHPARRE